MTAGAVDPAASEGGATSTRGYFLNLGNLGRGAGGISCPGVDMVHVVRWLVLRLVRDSLGLGTMESITTTN